MMSQHFPSRLVARIEKVANLIKRRFALHRCISCRQLKFSSLRSFVKGSFLHTSNEHYAISQQEKEALHHASVNCHSHRFFASEIEIVKVEQKKLMETCCCLK